MIELYIAGAITSVAAVALCSKLGMKRVLGHHAEADVVFTIAFVIIFSGTFSGMVAGAFAGLCFSIQLIVLRAFLGYERLQYNRKDGFIWTKGEPTVKLTILDRICAFSGNVRDAWKATA
jgi:hypothetical protein